MAIQRLISSYGNLCVFAETSSGRFGYVNNTTTSTVNTTTGNSMVIAAVSNTSDPRRAPSSWTGSYITQDRGIVTTDRSYTISEIHPYDTNKYGYGCTITIIDAHGTHYGTQNCSNASPPAEGYCVGVKHIAANEGYEFKGWRVTITKNYASYTQPSFLSSGGTTVGNVTTFNDYLDAVVIKMGQDYAASSIVIEALYEPFLVSFDANGGTGAPENIYARLNEKVTIPQVTPTRPGYDFAYWYDPVSEISYIPGCVITVTKDITLYAYYSNAGMVNVIFDANGGIGAPDSFNIRKGVFWWFPKKCPVKDGFGFIGWNESRTGQYTTYAPDDYIRINASYAQNSITFFAQWINSGTKYKIAFDLDGGTGGPSDIENFYDSWVNIPDVVPTKTDYTFAGWINSETGDEVNQGDLVHIVGNITIKALWESSPTPPPPHGGGSGMIAFGISGALLFNPSTGNLAYDN